MNIRKLFQNDNDKKIIDFKGHNIRIKDFFIDSGMRDVLFIFISIISVVLSFIGTDIFRFDLVWIAIIFCGIPIFKEAIIGLYREFDIKADVLVAVAIVSSILIGELFAAGVIAVIMAIGGFLEDFTVSKTKAGIKKLIDLNPTNCTLVINYNRTNESEIVIPSNLIKEGDVIKVVPGETVPVDGAIISGESSIDQSVLTGESIPVEKTIGSAQSSELTSNDIPLRVNVMLSV